MVLLVSVDVPLHQWVDLMIMTPERHIRIPFIYGWRTDTLKHMEEDVKKAIRTEKELVAVLIAAIAAWFSMMYLFTHNTEVIIPFVVSAFVVTIPSMGMHLQFENMLKDTQLDGD